MPEQRNRPVGTRAAQSFAAADTILAQTLDNADSWWRDCNERAVHYLAASGRLFTADDVRDLGAPDADHPNRLGALFAVMRGQGVIVPVGFTTSTRRSRHGGVLRVWRGAEHAEVTR